VPKELEVKSFTLFDDRIVPMPPTPLGNPEQTSAKALAHRLEFHRKVTLLAPGANVGKPQEIESLRPLTLSLPCFF
jgi:hypothetical protein